jgi:hypothetical protein
MILQTGTVADETTCRDCGKQIDLRLRDARSTLETSMGRGVWHVEVGYEGFHVCQREGVPCDHAMECLWNVAGELVGVRCVRCDRRWAASQL